MCAAFTLPSRFRLRGRVRMTWSVVWQHVREDCREWVVDDSAWKPGHTCTEVRTVPDCHLPQLADAHTKPMHRFERAVWAVGYTISGLTSSRFWHVPWHYTTE